MDENLEKQKKTFNYEYVKELREENASWRTKLRDTESKLNQLESKLQQQYITAKVAGEFAKRGIKADPSWVKVDGEDVEGAVNAFINEYPQLVDTNTTQPNKPTKPSIPQVGRGKQDTNTPSPGERSINEIREDPKARSQIREHYRQLLANKQNTL